MIDFNKDLLKHVSSDLDAAAMLALEESLVDIRDDNEPAHPTAEHGGGDASSGPVTDPSVVSYIGTNLLVDDQVSSNEDVMVDVDEPAVDESANEPNGDMFGEFGDDMADVFGSDARGDEREEYGEKEGQHATEDDIMEEEAIAHRVRPKYLLLLVW
jgi:hypothetical protein